MVGPTGSACGVFLWEGVRALDENWADGLDQRSAGRLFLSYYLLEPVELIFFPERLLRDALLICKDGYVMRYKAGIVKLGGSPSHARLPLKLFEFLASSRATRLASLDNA
jgi:hypothetical protein